MEIDYGVYVANKLITSLLPRKENCFYLGEKYLFFIWNKTSYLFVVSRLTIKKVVVLCIIF